MEFSLEQRHLPWYNDKNVGDNGSTWMAARSFHFGDAFFHSIALKTLAILILEPIERSRDTNITTGLVSLRFPPFPSPLCPGRKTGSLASLGCTGKSFG